MVIRDTVRTEHKKSTYLRIFNINIPGVTEQFFWNGCYCNEYDGMSKRHALGNIPTFKPYNQQLGKLRETVIQMSEHLLQSTGTLQQCDHKTIMANTRPAIRSRYQRAHDNIISGRLTLEDLDTRVKGFVKYEKMDISKLEKAPRMIQYRGFEYTYWLKSFILSHSLAIKSSGVKWHGQDVTTIFSKLHDSVSLAAMLRNHWDSFLDPVAICLDHSKFDGHYSKDLLEIEHGYWARVFKSRFLQRLLKVQLKNKGVTAHGLTYKTLGTRCSGEYTTSEGNSLLNYAMLKTWCMINGVESKIVVNGDDSIVFISRKDLSKLNPHDLSYFNNFNMETELDIIAEDFRLISFCQMKPIRIISNNEEIWYMVREPYRVLSRAQYMSSQHRFCVERVLAGIGLCDLAVYSGIPVLQNFALYEMASAKFNRPLGSVDKIPARASGRSEVLIRPVESVTRMDFEAAFGISVDEQLKIESLFAGQMNSAQSYKYISKYKNFILN